MIEGGRVFFDAAAQCLYEECGAAGSVREDFCLGQRVLRQEAFRADAATGKVFFVRHPLLTCAPQKSAGERTQGTHALEVRSSEIGFGRAESPEAFAPADSFSERDGRPEGSSWLFPSWKKSAGTLRAPWQMKDFFSDNSIPSTASSRARLRLLRAPEGEA